MNLIRRWFTTKSTIGELTLPGGVTIFILEDVARAPGVKIPSETAIPEGDYFVRITMSNRFGILTPIIYNRPDLTIQDGRGNSWAGVRIHPGNVPADTEACQLPGRVRFQDRVAESRDTFALVMAELTKALVGRLEIPYTIRNEQAK